MTSTQIILQPRSYTFNHKPGAFYTSSSEQNILVWKQRGLFTIQRYVLFIKSIKLKYFNVWKPAYVDMNAKQYI